MATQAEVAAHLFLSQTEVSRYIAAGVIPKAPHKGGLNIDVCRESYIRHIRERAAGRASDAADADDLDIVEQRARLAKEQADAQAMKNAVVRGELIPRQDVVAGMQAAFANARARLLSLPAKAAPLVIGLVAITDVVEKLTGIVHEACRELAETRAIPDAKHRHDDGGSGDGGSDDLGASTEADSERVGRPIPRVVGRGVSRTGRVEHI